MIDKLQPKITPALCLDIDGTVRRCKSGKPFIESLDDIELMPGIENILWRYREMGWAVIGISNQGGVAHGYKTPSDVAKEMTRMADLFTPRPVVGYDLALVGYPAPISQPFHFINTCIYDPTGTVPPYNVRSLWRKPDIGMLADAERVCYDHGMLIDWDKSIFVGDRPEDEECARRARIRYIDVNEFLNMPHEFTIG